MRTSALQHVITRVKRWHQLRVIRGRLEHLELLIDDVETDVVEQMAALIDMRAERDQVRRHLRVIERSYGIRPAVGAQ